MLFRSPQRPRPTHHIRGNRPHDRVDDDQQRRHDEMVDRLRAGSAKQFTRRNDPCCRLPVAGRGSGGAHNSFSRFFLAMLVFSKANVVKLLPRRRICTQWSKLLAAHCCDCEYAQQLLQRSGPFEVSQRLRSLLVMPQEKAFREFANGTSPRRIAVSLNEEGLAGPLGRSWRGHHDPRPCEPWHRPDQQRTLHRPPHLEPPALYQGPEHR